jgi:ectoine hydroxylase-related dioxygenase (phytanoyl-CoA dioxygenase family)
MSSLSAIQVEQYAKEGFLVVTKVFEPDYVDRLRIECNRLWQSVDIDESNRRIQWRKKIDGGQTADRIDPVLDISPVLLAAALEDRVTNPVSQLLPGSESEVFKGKVISKWPQTTGYAMHQDYCYWCDYTEAGPDRFVTALVALDRFDADSGTIEFFPGLHHRRIPPPLNNPNDTDEGQMDLSTGVLAFLDPGDVVFFHGLTPHRSGANLSNHNRESLFFTYVTAEFGDTTDRYYSGRPADFMEGN